MLFLCSENSLWKWITYIHCKYIPEAFSLRYVKMMKLYFCMNKLYVPMIEYQILSPSASSAVTSATMCPTWSLSMTVTLRAPSVKRGRLGDCSGRSTTVNKTRHVSFNCGRPLSTALIWAIQSRKVNLVKATNVPATTMRIWSPNTKIDDSNGFFRTCGRKIQH